MSYNTTDAKQKNVNKHLSKYGSNTDNGNRRQPNDHHPYQQNENHNNNKKDMH